jgi:hypothetical protein
MTKLLLLCLLCGNFVVASATAQFCKEQEQFKLSGTPRVIALPSGATITAEQGSELEYSQDGVHWRPLAMPGTRLGWHLFNAAGYRLVWFKTSLVPQAALLLYKNCDFTLAQTTWLSRLQQLAEDHDVSVTANAAKPAEIQELMRFASDDMQRALIFHVAANQAFLNNDVHSAADYFKTSKILWGKIGLLAYEAAAALGESSMVLRLNGFQQASKIADPYANMAVDRTDLRYFRTRLREELCQKFIAAGKLYEIGTCLSPILDAYLALGESGDYLNSLIKIAYSLPNAERIRAIKNGFFMDALARAPDLPALRTINVCGRCSAKR